MSYNGSGTFNINSTGQPVVAGTVITASAFNALTTDLATGLTTAITKDGQTTTTARIPFAQGINSSLVTDSSSTSTGSILTAGGVGIAKALYVGTTATVSQITSASATALTLQSAGTTAITVDTSQNVGIGTTSPGSKLHVSGDIYASGEIDWAGTGAGGSSLGFLASSGGNAAVGSRGATAFTMYTNGSERMRIDSGGNVQVRTTTNPNGIKFRVKGSDGDEFELDNDGSRFTSSYLSNNGTIKVSSYWDNTNARYYIVPVSNGVYLASGGVAWTVASDERKKDIIEPITDAANKVSQLRSVIGKYKTDANGTRRSFLIAQDVQSVFPEAVDATNPDELGLSYSDTIPLLVAAIKEQQATITALTARITALENA